ncbi:MAG: hypothetical protein AAGL10_10300 [Pseudomonadota bacterium]
MGEAVKLKGMWNGSFRYSASDDLGGMRFKARLAVNDGKLTGLIVEGSTISGDQIRAEIAGVFDGQLVRFTKRYIDADIAYARPVEYEGTVSSDGRTIKGTWTLPDDSGTFEMSLAA